MTAIPKTRWSFPSPLEAPEDLVGLGADLEPGTIIEAYRQGYFPMHVDPEVLGWWSPNPRGIIPLDGFRISRSLARSRRRFAIRLDTDFAAVIDGCADVKRPRGWITSAIRAAYLRLHELGWAHSVEAWSLDEPSKLAGGLYGVAIGGFFAAESKFHRETDASKVALAGLVDLMRERGGALLDVQWKTPHLERLGAVAIPREEYLVLLRKATAKRVKLFAR